MNKSLGLMTSGIKFNPINPNTNSGSSIVINYNPTITMQGNEKREEFLNLLKRHKNELVEILRLELERKERLSY